MAQCYSAMLERQIQFSRVERPDQAEAAAGARTRLASKFPHASLRRMTHLGLLVGAALDGVALGAEDAVVYASSYAETRALEDFLRSFPAASPLGFQTSIHPSAVQQVLIARQQPVRRFWPITGRRRLVESALLAALMEPAPRVFLVGGEERGTWLHEANMASDQAFAFGLVLGTDPSGAAGRVRFSPGGAGRDAPCPALPELAAAIERKDSLGWRGAGGEWSLEWL
jgi:hypothetical protein